MRNHKEEKHEEKKVKLTTGPFLVPEEVGPEVQAGRNIDRLVVTLTNPTGKTLQAKVLLAVFRQPEVNLPPGQEDDGGQIKKFKNLHEKIIKLGKVTLKPHTTTRLERDIPGGVLDVVNEKDERNAVYRVTAKGDFNTHNGQPAPGKLEISVVAGSVFNPGQPGLEQGAAVTFFRFKDFIVYGA